MTTHKIEEYKNKLNIEKKLIEGEIEKNNKPPDFGEGDISDPEGETDKTDAFSNQLAVVKDLKGRLGEINIALKKIENKKFGICERCGKEISEAILNIDPESRFCEDCKLLI